MTVHYAPRLTPHDVELVRGGSEADVTRLLRCGGRILRRGNGLRLGGVGCHAIHSPYALITFGAAHRRILVLLNAPGGGSGACGEG